MVLGMVFVIVNCYIDFLVGVLLVICFVVMVMIQIEWLSGMFGFGLDYLMIWVIIIVVGFVVGILIGVFQGWMVGYFVILVFIVMFGGFLVWCNVVWYLISGQIKGLLDSVFLIFGGINGMFGIIWSWIIGLIVVVVVVWIFWSSCCVKVVYGFGVKLVWVEVMIFGIIMVVIFGFVWILNSYNILICCLECMFEVCGEVMLEGLIVGYGLLILVLILIVVVIVMMMVVKCICLGCYIYVMGGNLDVVELLGINICFLMVKIFVLMGFFCVLFVVVVLVCLVNYLNDIGMFDELCVIVVVVIGGMVFVGGVGMIYGVIFGVFIMQVLQFGMVMVGVDVLFQNIVVGMVFVFVVFIDIVYCKCVGVK